MMKQDQNKQKDYSNLFAGLFIGAFALIPATVIGISIKDWLNEQKKVEQYKQNREQAKAKTAYYTAEAEKINQR